jgi:hypothetical protein
LNLGQFCDGTLGQWATLNRETDLALCYAVNIDEADVILRGLQQDGYINYELTMSAIRVQITVPGWRFIESLRNSPLRAVTKEQSTTPEDFEMKDELPRRIWTVQDYYQAKEFYEKRGLVFNPALERGSPAANHVIAQAQLQPRQERIVRDFFISYNQKDKQWAEWVAWILEEAGYSVAILSCFSWNWKVGPIGLA